MSPSRTATRQRRLSLHMLLLLFVATACSKSPPKQAGEADSLALLIQAAGARDSGSAARKELAPKEVVPIALASVQKDCQRWGMVCKDYTAPPEGPAHKQLTGADRANGDEDGWCVKVAYIRKQTPGAAWEDASAYVSVVKRSGAWIKLDPICTMSN